MNSWGPVPDLSYVRRELKDFQRETVDVVTHAFFEAQPAQRRFLVADEVGLGKTKVARAVVAETVRRLWDDTSVDRIDVVYLCSNHQIARQNIRDLDLFKHGERPVIDRITKLPMRIGELDEHRVNLVSLTPGTSFNMGQSAGQVQERALLHHMLSHPESFGPVLMNRDGAQRLFRNTVQDSTWDYARWTVEQSTVPDEVVRRFHRVIGADGLTSQIEELTDGRRWRAGTPDGTIALLSRLRQLLAIICIEMLTPDLIILDEFQRFCEIFDEARDDNFLARLLLAQPTARVLMLSATPYRMLSGAGRDGDHFAEFRDTTKFLLGPERDGDLARLDRSLVTLRHGVLNRQASERISRARDEAQDVLASVMVRTERLATTPDRNGMLRAAPAVGCTLTTGDVRGYVAIDRVARALKGAPCIVEYWKSAPYLFNFMDDYIVKRELEAHIEEHGVPASLSGPRALTWSTVNQYGAITPDNGRLRWLLDDLESCHALDLAWVPPALPQTTLAGVYARPETRRMTKRLIFSGWTVAPKAVAALVSYEHERHTHQDGATYSSRRGGAWALTDATGGPVSPLLPNRRLAELGDPARRARENGLSFPLDLAGLRSQVSSQIRRALQSVLSGAPADGREDVRWYTVSHAVLDPSLRGLRAEDFVDGGAGTGLARNLALLQLSPQELGRPPEDLIPRLTDIAIAGPACAARRSLGRVARRNKWAVSDAELMRASAQFAWGIRSLMDAPEMESVIRRGQGATPFWQAVLVHCAEGGFSSVLDEWLYVLPDQQRLDPTSADPLGELARAATGVLRLQTSSIGTDYFDGSTKGTHDLRSRFAVRFGQARGATAAGENPVRIRDAFNSPFWPFVLISTSVGQEGLDFHHYSHAVVHWNLPSNPVDLEQREGRVHRYKNHAVRKNVARRYGRDPRISRSVDPWTTAFAQAEADRPAGMSEIYPWWVFPDPDGAAIERHVPVLPLSRDHQRLEALIKATTLYRMALGQPRQAELLETLAGLSEQEVQDIQRDARIDLSPRSPSRTPHVASEV